MESLEERYQLLAMLRGALGRNQVYLRIGSELADRSLSGLSMVAANYGVARRNLGTVSLFGPTRMDYRLAMATVRARHRSCRGTSRTSMSDDENRAIDDRFEILEVWRRPLIGDGSAAVRVLAKVEAGAYGPEEYAVGISTRPDAQLAPLLDEADLFTGLSFAEAHWVAAVLASAAERVEDAESLLFDLRVPVDLAWRDVELASEVVEPGGLRSAPLVPWEPDAESSTPGALRDRDVHARLRPPGRGAAAAGPRRGAVLGRGRRGRPPRRAGRAEPHPAAAPRGEPGGGPHRSSRPPRPTWPATPTTTTRTPGRLTR